MRTLQEIDAEIKALQDERKAVVDAARPLRQRAQRCYVMIHELLLQLDELGEHVTDAEGYALHIKGKTFEINPSSGIEEVDR
jgi:hypothetical protein